MSHLSRRTFLAASAAAGAAACFPRLAFGQEKSKKPKREKLPVAIIATEYRKNSHADVIAGKILEGYAQDGGRGPDLGAASIYIDQFPESDKGRDLAKKYGFLLASSIEEAITLGGKEVAVAGVISIGEHGNYPYTPDTKQHMYPRRRFFDAIVAALQKHGRFVPVFNDKHLAYNWADAKHMYDTAQKLKIPFMAGSSLPVAWRSPEQSLPLGANLEAAILNGYGGLESYGFHALESLQCQLERRGEKGAKKARETGVAAVQAVSGDEILKAETDKRWSRELLEAALETGPRMRTGRPDFAKDATFMLIDYADGLRAAVAMNTGHQHEMTFAAKISGQKVPHATWFRLQDEVPYGHFGFLVKAIEEMVHTGKPSYPVERTLLTTGILDAVMHSAADGGKRIETPHLAIAYEPADWPFAPGEPGKTLPQ
jgi:hypothetical protein